MATTHQSWHAAPGRDMAGFAHNIQGTCPVVLGLILPSLWPTSFQGGVQMEETDASFLRKAK